MTAYEPPSHFAYKLLSGAPVRDHRGTVDLAESPGGTRVTYRVETTPTLPLIGRLVVAIVRLTVNSLLKGIVREAERRTAVAA